MSKTLQELARVGYAAALVEAETACPCRSTGLPRLLSTFVAKVENGQAVSTRVSCAACGLVTKTTTRI